MTARQRPMRSRMRFARLRKSVPGSKERSRLAILPWLLIPVAFLLGRSLSVERSEPPRQSTSEEEVPPDSEPIASATSSASAACCPCPEPKPPKVARPQKPSKKAPAPVEIERSPERDATAATARYLKDNAQKLASCAPKTGAQLRVHLEVTVSPSGAIERSRIANLDPVPPEVSACVEEVMKTLSPPGFDAARSEVFALTVVL
jgi:hypothetical protein